MRRIFICFLFFFTVVSKESLSQDYLNLDGKEYYKKGDYLYEFGILKIDVYKVFLYCDRKDCTRSDILNNNGSYALKFLYLRDIKTKYSKKGWEVGLKRNLKKDYRKYISEVNWLKDITKDMKKNDEVILHIDRNEFTYYKNDKVVAKITNAKLTNIIFLPWLGDNAITKACRKNLLGN